MFLKCLLSFRPTFGRGGGLTGRGASSVGRGAGLMSRTFDARQKIGSTDVRQRLGGSGGEEAGTWVTLFNMDCFIPFQNKKKMFTILCPLFLQCSK